MREIKTQMPSWLTEKDSEIKCEMQTSTRSVCDAIKCRYSCKVVTDVCKHECGIRCKDCEIYQIKTRGTNDN
jgi:hypothetical protein